MNRKLILVDLDGVVYNWIQAMANLLYTKQVIHIRRDLVSEYKTWEVWEDWDIPQGEFYRWWRLGVEKGKIYGEGPLIPGAREALWKLSDAEWNIAICTSRLNQFGLHDKIVQNTVNWLKDNNIPYRELLFTTDKTRIWADAIVDDVEEHMSAFAHQKRFLFPANHNTDHKVESEEQKDFWVDLVYLLLKE